MMSPDSAASQAAEHEGGGNKRTPCPLHGCKRVYADAGALESHLKDHEINAQSLPGKTLLCATVGCGGSFPNMQRLMEHTRHHHKPNIFFLCESCRTKLRSYRGLLTHLHTCSKVPRGKAKPSEPTPAAKTNLNRMDQNPPQLDSVSQPQQSISIPDGSFPAAVSQPVSAAPPLLGPPFLPNPETPPPQLAPQHLTEAAKWSEDFDLPPSLNLDGPTAAPEPPEARVHTAPGSAPHSPPLSSAVWKKNQGMVCSRRILWEHTRGRYTCVQCGHAVTNRKEMTQHINTYHSSNKPAEDTGSNAAHT